MDYADFLKAKSQLCVMHGFAPTFVPDSAFDFQAHLIDWATRKGRCAILADCGMGKTLVELAWAENVVRHTNKRVLILTPLAVAQQTISEADKFGIECGRGDGKITVANYEQLHHYSPSDFIGVVCDESSILKSFDGSRRLQITEFMKHLPYRLLATATAAPNDYTELGTSSEALGELGYMDMLGRFFKNDQNTIKPTTYRHRGQNFKKLDDKAKWRFKGHSEKPFWQWVCSWAMVARKPSDLGFEDDGFILPPLIEREHVVEARELAPGALFALPAVGLKEQRDERRRTITERCEMVAKMVADTGRPALVWCHLNAEGDMLERLIPGCVQVKGQDSLEEKEESFTAFANGNVRVLVTKPKIGAWGLNFQHCNHVTTFPSHSWEQYYQGIRRCWRFGQKRPVTVDIVTTEGELDVLKNLQRKATAADAMFASLVANMGSSKSIDRSVNHTNNARMPAWL